MRDKATWQCPQTTTFKENRTGIESRSFCLPYLYRLAKPAHIVFSIGEETPIYTYIHTHTYIYIYIYIYIKLTDWNVLCVCESYWLVCGAAYVMLLMWGGAASDSCQWCEEENKNQNQKWVALADTRIDHFFSRNTFMCSVVCVWFFFFNIPSTLRRKSKTHVRAHTHAHTFSSFLPIPETRIKQKTRGLHGWTCRLGWPSGEALVRLVITETDLGSIPLRLSTVFKSYGLLALSLLEILFLTINQTLKMALIAAHTHAEVILVSGDSTALGIVSLPSPHPTPTHTHWSGDLGPRQYLFSRRQLVGTQV